MDINLNILECKYLHSLYHFQQFLYINLNILECKLLFRLYLHPILYILI